MSGSSCYSFVISILEDIREGGHFVITSPDLPGLLLAGKDIEALRSDVPNVIRMLFELNFQMNVEVRPVVKPETAKTKIFPRHSSQWTAFQQHAA